MKRLTVPGAVLGLTLAAMPAAAATVYSSFTYSVDLTLSEKVEAASGELVIDPATGTFPIVRVFGTITTDGTLGRLSRANIVALDLRASDPVSVAFELRTSFSFPGLGSVQDRTAVQNLIASEDDLEVDGAFSFGWSGSSVIPAPSGLTRIFSGDEGSIKATGTGISREGVSGTIATQSISAPRFVLAETTAFEVVPPAVPLPATIWLGLAALTALLRLRRVQI